MTLTEFVLARIAEDEATARKAQQGRWKLWGYDVLADTGGDNDLGRATPVADVTPIREDRPDGSWFFLTWNARHIANWDPARVLAECEAKRRIVDRYLAQLDRQRDPEESQLSADICVREYEEWVLTPLAAIWSGHPDYQQEWAP